MQRAQTTRQLKHLPPAQLTCGVVPARSIPTCPRERAAPQPQSPGKVLSSQSAPWFASTDKTQPRRSGEGKNRTKAYNLLYCLSQYEGERDRERERLGAVLASLKADEMRLSAVLGLKECALGPSWDVSGRSWSHLRGAWSHRGPSRRTHGTISCRGGGHANNIVKKQ